VRVVRVLLLSLWATGAVLAGLFASTVVIAPLILEGQLPVFAIPWIFIIVAIAASALAATISRLVPSVAASYSWRRLLVSGIASWPVAWWSGMGAMRFLEDAQRAGIFAITFGLEHMSLWYAVIILTATLLLLGPREPTPSALTRA
jgi:hypothetical protein